MKKKIVKKYRLKEGIKTALLIAGLELVLFGALTIYTNKIEAIENGKIIQVNENMMDR